MNIELHPSEERGHSDLGWLTSRFSFSFADYYNPKRMGFGKLRVLNDDIVAPSAGFPSHPHRDMEIITIPTHGALAHQDSTGVKETVSVGEVQVMTAGSGIVHSEFNASQTEEGRFFQIWIEPNRKGLQPRHEKRAFKIRQNVLQSIVSGDKTADTLHIHQDATIALAMLDKEHRVTYSTKKGLFLFVVEGSVHVAGHLLKRRDAIALSDPGKVDIEAKEESSLLVIDVPLW